MKNKKQNYKDTFIILTTLLKVLFFGFLLPLLNIKYWYNSLQETHRKDPLRWFIWKEALNDIGKWFLLLLFNVFMWLLLFQAILIILKLFV